MIAERFISQQPTAFPRLPQAFRRRCRAQLRNCGYGKQSAGGVIAAANETIEKH